MCKLCNTNNSPTTTLTDNYKHKLFHQVVLDYLEELPCEPCCIAAINKWDRTVKTDDNLDFKSASALIDKQEIVINLPNPTN